MKKTSLFILTIFLSFYSTAQDSPKQKEVGLVMSNFDNFGLTYRFGTSKSLWRLNTLFLRSNELSQVSDSLEQASNSFGVGIAIGKEFRNPITNNLEFRYGVDLSFNYSSAKSTIDDKTSSNNDRETGSTIYKPGVNFVFGLNYVIKDNFIIGAELLPGIVYSTGTRETYNFVTGENDISDISGFSYGITNTSARLSFLLRF